MYLKSGLIRVVVSLKGDIIRIFYYQYLKSGLILASRVVVSLKGDIILSVYLKYFTIIFVSEIWPDKRGGLPKGGHYTNILLSVYLKSGLIRVVVSLKGDIIRIFYYQCI